MNPLPKILFTGIVIIPFFICAMDRDNDAISLFSINGNETVVTYCPAQVEKYAQAQHARALIDSLTEVQRINSTYQIDDPEWIRQWIIVNAARFSVIAGHRPWRKVDENPLISELLTNMAREYSSTFKQIMKVHDIFESEEFEDCYFSAAKLAMGLPSEDIDVQKNILSRICPTAANDFNHNHFYAALHDRIAFREGRLLRFGAFGYYEPVKTLLFDPNEQERIGRWIVYPIAEPEHVDERRQAINMPPLGEHQKKIEKSIALFRPYLNKLNYKQICDLYFKSKEVATK